MGLLPHSDHRNRLLKSDNKSAFCFLKNHTGFYYYDRAGNLVRTVAPRDVNLKDNTGTSVTNSMQHNADTMATRYKYNSLKQLVLQSTPDGDSTWFWYDYKGEVRFTQNKKQKRLATPTYSYTKYDNLTYY